MNPQSRWHFYGRSTHLNKGSLQRLLKMGNSWLDDVMISVALHVLCQQYSSWGMAESIMLASKNVAVKAFKRLMKVSYWWTFFCVDVWLYMFRPTYNLAHATLYCPYMKTNIGCCFILISPPTRWYVMIVLEGMRTSSERFTKWVMVFKILKGCSCSESRYFGILSSLLHYIQTNHFSSKWPR